LSPNCPWGLPLQNECWQQHGNHSFLLYQTLTNCLLLGITNSCHLGVDEFDPNWRQLVYGHSSLALSSFHESLL
jgi:hypothetical protein